MPKFDESKDEVIASESFADDREGTIEVKIASYQGGESKLQFSRFTDEERGRKPLKLGRLTKREAVEVRRLLDTMLDKMGADDSAPE